MQSIGAFGAAGAVSGGATELTFACHNNLPELVLYIIGVLSVKIEHWAKAFNLQITMKRNGGGLSRSFQKTAITRPTPLEVFLSTRSPVRVRLLGGF
jgi:hypothetical protein